MNNWNWTPVAAPGNGGIPSRLYVDQEDNNTWYVRVHMEGLYVTRDAGSSWENHFGANHVSSFAPDPHNFSRFYVTVGNKLFATDDKGSSWHEVHSFDVGLGFTSLIVRQLNGDILAGPGGNEAFNGIFKSTDDGATWTFMDFGAAVEGGPICWVIAEDADNDALYVGLEPAGLTADQKTPGYDPPLFRSLDGGLTWDDINGSGYHVIDIAVSQDSGTVYFQSESRALYRSDNLGTDWQQVNGNVPFGWNATIDSKFGFRVFMSGGHTWNGVYLISADSSSSECIGFFLQKAAGKIALDSTGSRAYLPSWRNRDEAGNECDAPELWLADLNRKILVDASRDGGVWWYPQDSQFDSTQPHQGLEFEDFLRNELRYQVTTLPRTTPSTDVITTQLLSQYNVVVRAVGVGNYGPSEIQAYSQFVHEGGSLLLLSAHGHGDQLSLHFGLRIEGCENGTVVFDDDHVLTKGISPHPYIAGGVIIKPPKEATILGHLSSGHRGASGPAVFGATTFGKGKIVFCGNTRLWQKNAAQLVRASMAWL